ncbi:hypothetical protein ACVI1J_009456 [Bradyrhizobium diazoefficiens]
MTNSSDPKKSPKDQPLCGGSYLVPDSDGFMMRLLPEATRMALAFKEIYVLELLAMQADPDFSLRDQYLRIVAERVFHRFVLRPKPGVLIAWEPPSPRTLRRWYRTYLESGCDVLALLPARPQPNREPASCIDPGPPLRGEPWLVRDDDGFMRSQSSASPTPFITFKKACVLELLNLEADTAFVLRAWHVPIIVERAMRRLGLGPDGRPLALATLRAWRRADADAKRIDLFRKYGPSALDSAPSGDR